MPYDSGNAFVPTLTCLHLEDAEIAARAGEFQTFLCVRGDQSLIEHLRRAWSGLWTDRAIHNRTIFGCGGEAIGGGVIVQAMVCPRVAGVLQTCNASECEQSQIVINAGLGLGEGIVSGTVAADQIVVSKENDCSEGALHFRYITADKREQVVFDKHTGSGTTRVETLYHQRLRPALEYVELCDLVKVARRLESDYGYALDIEFAIEGTRLWILQARPISSFIATLRETLDKHPLFRVQ